MFSQSNSCENASLYAVMTDCRVPVNIIYMFFNACL